MANTIRCINADERIRELPEKLANNKPFMEKYGWRIEDIKQEQVIDIPVALEPQRKVETVEVKINTEEVAAVIDEKIAELKTERVIKRRKPRTKKP